ncbi:MAG: PaaI family thioesterase [Candidatus Dormibacteraceae bacterium]
MAEITMEQARGILEETPFARWWGLTVEEVGEGWATVGLGARPELLRPGQVLHGSCYEVTADLAMWLAVMTRIGIETMAVTVEMKTSFLRGATTDIRSRAEVLRMGRRLAFGVATTTAADGSLVAHSTLTYVRPD